jgi:hypothetical protein
MASSPMFKKSFASQKMPKQRCPREKQTQVAQEHFVAENK